MKKYIRYYFKFVRYSIFNNIPYLRYREISRYHRRYLIYKKKHELDHVYDLSDMD